MPHHVDCIILIWHQISGWLANEIKKTNKALCVACFMSEHCITHTHTHQAWFCNAMLTVRSHRHAKACARTS